MKENISYITAPITNKTPEAVVSLKTIYEAITGNDSYKKVTEEYRKVLNDPESDDRAVRVAKVNSFDYVTMSGTFDYVSSKHLKEHSGYICIDIDKLENRETVHQLKERLIEDNMVGTSLLFVSPSGNGLKWVIPITIDQDNAPSGHLKYFRALQSYVKNNYNVDIDESCKDVSRACFLCYDEHAYFNEDVIPIGEDFIETWGQPEVKYNSSNGQLETTNDTPWQEYNERGDVAQLLRNYAYTFVKSEGKGDKYLRPGNPTSEYSLIVFRDTGVVHVHSDSCPKLSVGTHTPARIFCDLEANGDWKLAAKLLKQQGFEGSSDEKTFNIISGASLPSDVPMFWDITKDKKTQAYKCEIKTFNFHSFCKKELKIARVKRDGDKKGQLIRSHDKIIEKIEIDEIPGLVIEFLKDKIAPYNQELFQAIYESFYNYWKGQALEKLESFVDKIDPKLLREEPDCSYIYYRNGYLEISPTEVNFKPYKGLETFIWKDQINPRKWLGKVDYKDTNWYDFCWCISGQDKDRMEHLRTSYGYMIHSYKDRAIPKAVILVDEEVKEDLSKASGGTGKSIAARALKRMKPTREIAGKTWDPTNRFAFSQVEFGDKIMWIDDAPANLKFELLYNALTQDFEIERKGMDRYSIPFEDAPKVIISTNHPIRGDDASSVRRQHIVEVAPYFSAKFTAKDKYGEYLIEDEDWDEKDWQAFDNFMVDCVQMYLRDGLSDLEINYRYKRTVSRITPELFEWIEATLTPNTFYSTSEILTGKKPKDSINGFCMEYPDIKKSSRYIGSDLEVYCNYKGWELKKDRVGNTRGYILSTDTED